MPPRGASGALKIGRKPYVPESAVGSDRRRLGVDEPERVVVTIEVEAQPTSPTLGIGSVGAHAKVAPHGLGPLPRRTRDLDLGSPRTDQVPREKGRERAVA
jgi:hypothetical protein